MRNDKHLAVKMRRAGKSYKVIRQELGIPLSTLSDWFSHLEWSAHLRKVLVIKTGKVVSKATKARWEAWRQSFRDQAAVEFATLSQEPLFISGICLYWGEGDNSKLNSHVKLVNTDPRMITLFTTFLRKIVGVPEEKIHAWLVIYDDLSDRECKKFWSKVSQIPEERFYKTQVIKGRHPTKRTAYGMCTIQINSRELKEKIFTWRDLLYKQQQADYQ